MCPQLGQTTCTQLPRLLGNRGPQLRRKTMPMVSKPAPQGNAPKGAISKLQEFVQCSQTFNVPANYSVLQWDFDSEMADSATLQFRAIVAFLLNGVPHHVAG